MNARLCALVLFVVSACGSPTPAPPVAAPAPTTAATNATSSTSESIALEVETRIPPPVQVRGEERYFSLAERMKTHRVPAVSIAVFENNKIVWAKAYGMSDAGKPATTETMFQAASISKPVNALAVAIASERGLLDIDRPINEYLKSWKLPSNALTSEIPVTTRHLLTHTAGTTVHGFGGYPSGSPVPTLAQLLDGKTPANSPAVRVDIKPGSKVRYSGGGISIVQMAMLDILGKPYPEILKSLVLDPLGMTNSTFAQPLPQERLDRAAAGYHRNGAQVPTKRHVYPEMAAAGLWTTPSDLARFLIAISKARNGMDSALSKTVATQMTSPAIPATEPDSAVALGMFLNRRGDQWMFGHGGANEGFRCNAAASRDGGFGYVIMTNSDNGSQLADEIELALLSLPGWPSMPPVERVALDDKRRQQLPGRFTAGPGNPFEIAVEADRIEMRRPFRKPVELVPVAGGDFVSVADGARYTLDLEGRTLSIAIPGASGRTLSAQRLGDGALVPLLELAAGRFDAAVSAWREIEHTQPKSPALNEGRLNGLGYQLLGEGENDKALLLLRFITVVRPASANAFDSLGEAHAIRGETAAAISAYEKSLALIDADKSIPAESKPALRSNGEQRLGRLRAGANKAPTRRRRNAQDLH